MKIKTIKLGGLSYKIEKYTCLDCRECCEGCLIEYGPLFAIISQNKHFWGVYQEGIGDSEILCKICSLNQIQNRGNYHD